MTTLNEIDDPAELEHAKTLMRRLTQSAIIRERYEAVSSRETSPFSQLGRDDEATSWMALSHVVTMALGMATDNMRAVQGMLLVDGQLMIPLYAHYPVLRSILESAAEAKWILLPDERKERVHRLLRARVSDIKQDFELAKIEKETLMMLDEPPTTAQLGELSRVATERNAKHMTKAQQLAAANGIEWSAVKNGLPPWVHMIKAVCAIPAMNDVSHVPGGYAAGIWKIMSGLSHPSASRSARHSALERLSETPTGMIHAQVTASMQHTVEASTVAFNTVNEAVDLFELRKTLIG